MGLLNHLLKGILQKQITRSFLFPGTRVHGQCRTAGIQPLLPWQAIFAQCTNQPGGMFIFNCFFPSECLRSQASEKTMRALLSVLEISPISSFNYSFSSGLCSSFHSTKMNPSSPSLSSDSQICLIDTHHLGGAKGSKTQIPQSFPAFQRIP